MVFHYRKAHSAGRVQALALAQLHYGCWDKCPRAQQCVTLWLDVLATLAANARRTSSVVELADRRHSV